MSWTSVSYSDPIDYYVISSFVMKRGGGSIFG